MRRPFVFAAATLLAACLLWPGWGGAFQSEGTVRIGGMWPLSGPAAFFGKAAYGLASLAVDEINEAGGLVVEGKRVKLALHAQDEACNAEQGLAVVKRLATVDKVIFSLGPGCSSAILPCRSARRRGCARGSRSHDGRTQPPAAPRASPGAAAQRARAAR